MESSFQKVFTSLSTAQPVSVVIIIILLLSPALPAANRFKLFSVTDGHILRLLNNYRKNTTGLAGIEALEKSKEKNEPSQRFSQNFAEYPANPIINNPAKADPIR